MSQQAAKRRRRQFSIKFRHLAREGRCTSGLYEAPDGSRIKYTDSTRTERATFAVA